MNTLENVCEDPLTSAPGGLPPLSSSSSTSSWPTEKKIRSISLTGQPVSVTRNIEGCGYLFVCLLFLSVYLLI